ncbi:hypothetical protein PRUPE_2G050400 [Prunus persica]|uniref:Uncharacterized protein n=1 Tax=Prunus persica TaxID=3760 RepID=A0A251QCL8_PRUPE|nr:hypothetical protein PRUPE_2G050400 [Prunus persica]
MNERYKLKFHRVSENLKVFGAIWYFFAIQRVGICWHEACRKENGCSASTFSCHDHHTFRNIAFLNDLCPISPMNATLFDFGIYAKVLQSGIPGSTNYFQKFSYCFWLGLRHLRFVYFSVLFVWSEINFFSSNSYNLLLHLLCWRRFWTKIAQMI